MTAAGGSGAKPPSEEAPSEVVEGAQARLAGPERGAGAPASAGGGFGGEGPKMNEEKSTRYDTAGRR